MNFTFAGISVTIRSGALIPLLLMLPNVVWMALPQINAGEPVAVPQILTIVENLGRAAVLILPFFYWLRLDKKYSTLAAVATVVALTIYYAAWIRYFAGGRTAELMRAPLLGIPLPLAVAPIAFLMFSSYLMSSWLLFGSAIVFGIAHIWISALTL